MIATGSLTGRRLKQLLLAQFPQNRENDEDRDNFKGEGKEREVDAYSVGDIEGKGKGKRGTAEYLQFDLKEEAVAALDDDKNYLVVHVRRGDNIP